MFGYSAVQGRPSHGVNETEIFIIPNLGRKFGILGSNTCFCQFSWVGNVKILKGEENSV